MKNEITVGKFLELLKTSIWRDLNENEKSSLYNGYYSRIEGLLHGLNDNVLIKDIDSLKGLTDSTSFDAFLRESTFEELDKRFYAIAMEIGTWKVHMLETIELQGKVSIRKRRGKVGFFIIILLLIVALAGGAVLIATSFGSEMTLLNSIMGAILSAADIVLGIVFFLYEFKSDHDEKNLTENIEKAKENGSANNVINNYKIYIGKQINKNRGDVINGDKIENHHNNNGYGTPSGRNGNNG